MSLITSNHPPITTPLIRAVKKQTQSINSSQSMPHLGYTRIEDTAPPINIMSNDEIKAASQSKKALGSHDAPQIGANAQSPIHSDVIDENVTEESKTSPQVTHNLYLSIKANAQSPLHNEGIDSSDPSNESTSNVTPKTIQDYLLSIENNTQNPLLYVQLAEILAENQHASSTYDTKQITLNGCSDALSINDLLGIALKLDKLCYKETKKNFSFPHLQSSIDFDTIKNGISHAPLEFANGIAVSAGHLPFIPLNLPFVTSIMGYSGKQYLKKVGKNVIKVASLGLIGTHESSLIRMKKTDGNPFVKIRRFFNEYNGLKNNLKKIDWTRADGCNYISIDMVKAKVSLDKKINDFTPEEKACFINDLRSDLLNRTVTPKRKAEILSQIMKSTEFDKCLDEALQNLG